MAVQLNGKPLAGFDQPIEMLCDCHRRVEHFLDVQLRVAEMYQNLPLDEEARSAIENARNYFAESAPKHTADEEESLFPRLREVENLSSDCQQAMKRLEDDHQHANQLHATIDAILYQWLGTEAALPVEAGATLIAHLKALRELYREHIRIEEQEVFPQASRALPMNKLWEVGKEMRIRRGVVTS
jgi:hemerythrin-like domain-containing protein